MRHFLLILAFVAFAASGQRSPVGLIVKFQNETSFEDKQAILAEVDGLKPLKKEHDLNGFDITLAEASGDYPEVLFFSMQSLLEEQKAVIFTSVLYQTDLGAVGGDLQELYVMPKGNFDAEALKNEHNLVSAVPHHFLSGAWVFTLNKHSTDIRELQSELQSTENFDFVSVNTFHSVLATVSDPYFENQWALENDGGTLHFDGTPGADMEVVNAWDISTGSEEIKIAVLDSGTDTNHVDLMGNLLPGFDATGGGSMGYPNTTYSNDAHGTCAAGIVAAMGDNDIGVAGVAYSCKIIPVKIFYYIEFAGDVIPFTSGEAGTEGIIWAVNTGKADVLSNSWGLRSSDIVLLGIDTAMSNAIMATNINEGREGKGTPMLFSSGNEADDFSIWPAAYPLTISVGASTMCDELKSPTDCSPEGWWGSNYGDNLDVTAPGVKVLSTDMSGILGYNSFMDNDYSMFNGTSAACPNAAGVMALILSVNPELTAHEARGILSITADKTGGYDYDSSADFGMQSEEMGYGRVNAYEAVYYASNFTQLQETETVIDRVWYHLDQVVLDLGETENTEIVLFNTLGNEVIRLNGSAVGSMIYLTHYKLASGLYLAQINRPNRQETLKVVIN